MTAIAVEHVERSMLPWRDEALTECGLPVVNHPTITRTELVARVKREGLQRAGYSICQTCLSTAQRWATWEDNPADVMAREASQASYGRPGRRGDRHAAMRTELLAIALLIEAHRDEFDEAVAGLTEAPTLFEARQARARRERRERTGRSL